MQVASYTYQSPSSSAVQVGKLDPASVKEESKSSESSSKTFANQTSEVKPTPNTEHLLDIYA